MEIWTGVTDASLTDSQRKDRATQLLIKYKSGALVTQQAMHQKMIIKEAGKSSEPGEKKEEEGDVEDKSQVTQVRV